MKILVVEDDPKHREDAVRFLSTQDGVDVVTADSGDDAVYKMRRRRSELTPDKEALIYHYTPLVDGVITDIHIPLTLEPQMPKLHGNDHPVGLWVAAEAHQAGIPFVFCTDRHHHNATMEWIHHLTETMRWPFMIDKVENGRKDWEDAYKLLLKQMKK